MKRILVAVVALGVASCAAAPPPAPSPAWEFALRYQPTSTEDAVVPGLPEPDDAARAELRARPLPDPARRAVALVGTKLYRYHVDCFAQSYELRREEPNPFLLAFAALSGRDIESTEFLPSRAIYEWAVSQPDLARDPLFAAETERIESALQRDRWNP